MEGLLAIAMPAILKAHLVDQVGAAAPEVMLEPHLAAAQAGQEHLGRVTLEAQGVQIMCRTALVAVVVAQAG